MALSSREHTALALFSPFLHDRPLKIQCLRDRNNCDLDDDYMAIEIFSSNDVLKVIRLQGETDTMKPEACETSNAFPPQTLPTKSNQELVKIEKTEPPSSCFSSQSLEATSAEHESKSFLSVSSLSSSASLASSDLDDDETTHAPASFQQTVSAEPESDGESTSYKSSSTEQEDSEPDTDEDVDPDPDPDGDNVRRALEAKYEEERKTEDSVSVLKRKFTGDSDSDSDSDGESELTSHQQTTIIHQNDHDSHSDRHETESELEFESLEECAPSALLTNTNQGPFLVTQAPHTLFQKESMPSAPDPLHRSSFSSPFLSSPLGYGSKTDKRANVKNIKEESSAAHRLTKVKEEAPENDGHDASETSSDSSSSDDESSSRRSLASLPSLKSMKINKPSVPPPVVVTVQKPNTAHAKPVIAKKPLAKKAYSAAIFSSN